MKLLRHIVGFVLLTAVVVAIGCIIAIPAFFIIERTHNTILFLLYLTLSVGITCGIVTYFGEKVL